MDKVFLIINAINTQIYELMKEIDRDKYLIYKNADDEMFKEYKLQSIETNKLLIDEYKELLKELENEKIQSCCTYQLRR